MLNQLVSTSKKSLTIRILMLPSQGFYSCSPLEDITYLFSAQTIQ